MKWWTEPVDTALSEFKVTASSGLSFQDAAQRLQKHGYNQLDYGKRTSAIIRFLKQFHNILIYILLASAVMTMFLEHWLDTVVILGVVVLNAIVGFIQEGKAEKSLEAIRNMLDGNARVVRDGGKHLTIAAKELVPGDIVELKNGDKVPADLRLLSVHSLQIQEAILTGESDAVTKQIEPLAEDAALGDRTNMAFSGSTVVYGRGEGVVVATGKNSELGQMGVTLEHIGKINTPLMQQMDRLSFWLMVVILLLASINFLVGVGVWHLPTDSTFLAAVGLAVAAVPEGLPPILTVILAIGVKHMAKQCAIVRHLPVIDTMGAVDVICTDKTGTLTRNEQVIQAVILADGGLQVQTSGKLEPMNLEGVQAAKHAAIDDINKHPVLTELLHCAALCNEGHYNGAESDDNCKFSGNPIDQALLKFVIGQKLELQQLAKDHPQLNLMPYESELKMMATIHQKTGPDSAVLYVKGAPEKLVTCCTQELTSSGAKPINLDYWHQIITALAKKGYRLIALAYQQAESVDNAEFKRLQDTKSANLILIGVISLMDAPREQVRSAIQECHEAGIEVKMITGDHAMTATTIASEVGIDVSAGSLTGAELDAMSDQELQQRINDVNIYARTSPSHKLRLVEALQSQGKIVAMTGDGANDAAALRKANVGVAMGGKGAEVVKEAADIVLADDNFTTIVAAVKAGRVVYDNVKKVILHTLPTNMAEAAVILLAILSGSTLPITPLQILWVNMVTSVFVSSALGFESPEDMVMKRPPRQNGKPMFSMTYLIYMSVVTVVLTAAVFGAFNYLLRMDQLSLARTTSVNVLIFGELAFLFNCRKLRGKVFSCLKFTENPMIFVSIGSTLAIQLIFTYVVFMHNLFDTSNMRVVEWCLVGLAMLAIFIISEIYKQTVLKTAE